MERINIKRSEIANLVSSVLPSLVTVQKFDILIIITTFFIIIIPFQQLQSITAFN